MHYKDGQEAQLGDVVKFTDHVYADGKAKPVSRAGMLISATAGSMSCNGQVAFLKGGLVPGEQFMITEKISGHCVTIGECELLLRPGADEKPADAPAAEAAPAQG